MLSLESSFSGTLSLTLLSNSSVFYRYPSSIRLDSLTTSRWELYEIIESVLENSHYGKVCLLRMICEVADVPFNRMHGLAGQLFRVLFT